MTDVQPSRVETVGLLSDIHANAVALEAVLADMPTVDTLVHAGDVVGYGPSPNECIDILREHDATSVRGNHDEALFGGPVYESGDEHAIRTLTEDNIAWVRDRPDERMLFNDRLRVVHGHPEDRFRYTYPATFGPSLLAEEDVLVLGHTHVQGKAETEAGIVVNPGSVGQPRDGDERAAYAVLKFDPLRVSLRRVEYEIDRVRERIAETPIPESNARRLEQGA